MLREMPGKTTGARKVFVKMYAITVGSTCHIPIMPEMNPECETNRRPNGYFQLSPS
jgi:hypothetical protein